MMKRFLLCLVVVALVMPVLNQPTDGVKTSSTLHSGEKTGGETMDTAESAVFLPRFTYRRTQSQRYRF
ncbi:hypothetical protein TcasGA2_TC033540 [Tribolium castaneum]|uniref:Uncharacterized protein n=1 Tax=Tribolium castaneum TaxID=7070 RepID=A0A139WFU9_TRICA|nr:hypothetical protein TcasGA2_TC033540 [Tribolium castaneum]